MRIADDGARWRNERRERFCAIGLMNYELLQRLSDPRV